MQNLIIHDTDRCDGCGTCVGSCPQLVYSQSAEKAIPDIAAPARCFGCLWA
jgi:NAD-dependent dihydropyrimidine dehydrogenase PreA subunit